MASLNRVFLIGNLTRDPELRYIPSGTAVATFTVASNRSYTLQSGEKKDEACFVRVVVWAKRAELCGQYLSKGSPVFVEGRLQSRSWETPDGQKRSTLEVVALNIQFLAKGGSKPAEETVGALKEEHSSGGEEATAPEQEVPPQESGSGDVPF
ncbi:MAG: single-stranded DNA-binding protein [Candidatus Omnitrophica bacterium]|nr:single-stranded DNA-binding protein [Candidatus Omnitrophota bacterium]